MNANLPKCSSWFGHRFEPRYTTEESGWPMPSLGGQFADLTITTKGIDMKDLQPASKRTYYGDVCVKCGAVVNRPHSP